MPIQFNKFKTRYIFLDFLLLSNILAIASLLFVPSLESDILRPFSITGNIFHIVVFFSVCGLIICRLKYCQIETRQLMGDLKIKNISWILLLIIFYGQHTLTSGVNYLEYYFANLISPDLVQSSVRTITEGTNYSSASFVSQFFQYLLLMFVLVIVAPLTEEFIFRGIFLHRWAVKWGVLWSIILSSLLFGAIHADIFWFSRALGSIFTALYYIQTKTLLVPIILHALNNGLVFIDLLFHHFKPSTVEEINITTKYIWYGIVNITLAIPILVYFLKLPHSIEQLPYFCNQKNKDEILS